MDPWVVIPSERARHEEQFRSLGPAPNGMVTGVQARNFLLQSGLPPMVLAQVWGLADVNGDGQMDINEFSIACKLITNKLKGVDIPKVLPPSMLACVAAAPPNSLPGIMQQPGMMRMPAVSMGMGMMPGAGQPGMMPGAGQPGMMPGAGQPGMMMGMGQHGMGMSMAQPGMGMISGAPIMSAGMMPVTSMPMAVSVAPQVMPMQPPASMASGSGASTPASLPITDWAIPQPTRAKYMATFGQTDRGRTGFLAGVQARNILLQSGLPQNILAHIWGLSDYDNDGKLTTEEFILAGHLCELASKGEPLPGTLPPNLVPPSMRKGVAGQIVGTPGGGSVVSAEDVGSPSTFEDKRKENFTKGQAELERRRQSLVDQQKKEEEERKKKEREEAEAKEKQRLEVERRRQAEIERQLQRQREARQQAEEHRRQMEEQRRAARQEMERQRLKEWEATRKSELQTHRQREQEKVLTLKAKHEHLNKDLDALREKVHSLTTNISETRSGVTEVKTFIDGMRASRDTKMQDMSSLKAQLKDQNERLLKVTQEKAKLDAKNKALAQKVEEGRDPELTEYEIKKKEKEEHVAELKEKLEKLKEKEDETRSKYENEKKALDDHREHLKQIIETCKSLYSEFDEKRREVKAEKAKRIRELTDPDHAWKQTSGATPVPPDNAAETGIQYVALYDYNSENADDLSFKTGDILIVHPDQPHEPGWLGGELDGKVGWFPEAYAEPVQDQPVENDVKNTDQDGGGEISSTKARVLYPWESSESDQEMSLTKGNIVEVLDRNDPDWWYGKDESGKSGYFPANHVSVDDLEPRGTTPTEPPEVGAKRKVPETEMAVALYPYSSEEPGDLNFEAGEKIEIVKKEKEWWTGKIGDRHGVFPFNYVELTTVNDVGKPQNDVSEAPAVETSDSEDKGLNWTSSASHVTHQVGVSEETEAKPVVQQPVTKSVSVDQSAVEPVYQTVETIVAPASTAAVESAVSPADLVNNESAAAAAVTFAAEPTADTPAAAAATAEAGAGHTGTGKRKSKKKRDESEGRKKPELATVVANFEATSKEQLTLAKGTMILVRKKTETGWWQGEIQATAKGKKRQIGWFPASYVKLMGGGDKGGGGSASAVEESLPKFRALYPYAGQHEDELAFQAGDIISLISKDEEAWWKGELNGLTGVFPSNYVEPIN